MKLRIIYKHTRSRVPRTCHTLMARSDGAAQRNQRVTLLHAGRMVEAAVASGVWKGCAERTEGIHLPKR